MAAAKSKSVLIKAGGETHRLRFSMGAMLRFQEETGKSFIDALQSFNGESPDLLMMRDILRCGLEGGKSIEDVNAILEDMDFTDVVASISEAAEASFPQEDTPNAGEDKDAGNAKKPAAKTKT